MQTLEEFRKDHELRDVSVSQAPEKPPWVVETHPSLASTPARQRVFGACTQIMFVYLLKTLQNLPTETPRRLWRAPPFLCRPPLPQHALAGPGTWLMSPCYLTNCTGSLYVMSAPGREFCLVCPPLTSLLKQNLASTVGLKKYFCMESMNKHISVNTSCITNILWQSKVEILYNLVHLYPHVIIIMCSWKGPWIHTFSFIRRP